MHFVKAKGILSSNNGINLFRGCTHGCIYCDSRSSCYQMKHRFEDVEVKENGLRLLEDRLRCKRSKCMIGMGSMTDPYIDEELELNYTRRALELVCKYGFGVTLLTKSANVLRDLDLFREIDAKARCVLQMTLTTFDEKLCKLVEPNVSTTRERFEVLKVFGDEGIPTVVWLTPILPFINDTEENILGVLDYCKEAKVKGIVCFGMGLTLRAGNREHFYSELDRRFPGLKGVYIKEFRDDYVANSVKSRPLMHLFHSYCKQEGIMHDNDRIFAYLRAFEDKGVPIQPDLF